MWILRGGEDLDPDPGGRGDLDLERSRGSGQTVDPRTGGLECTMFHTPDPKALPDKGTTFSPIPREGPGENVVSLCGKVLGFEM